MKRKSPRKPSAASRTLPLYPGEEPPKPALRVVRDPKPVSYAAFLVKGGLVEVTALKTFERFGRWPQFFLEMVGGVVPERLQRRGEELRRAYV